MIIFLHLNVIFLMTVFQRETATGFAILITIIISLSSTSFWN